MEEEEEEEEEERLCMVQSVEETSGDREVSFYTVDDVLGGGGVEGNDSAVCRVLMAPTQHRLFFSSSSPSLVFASLPSPPRLPWEGGGEGGGPLSPPSPPHVVNETFTPSSPLHPSLHHRLPPLPTLYFTPTSPHVSPTPYSSLPPSHTNHICAGTTTDPPPPLDSHAHRQCRVRQPGRGESWVVIKGRHTPLLPPPPLHQPRLPTADTPHCQPSCARLCPFHSFCHHPLTPVRASAAHCNTPSRLSLPLPLIPTYPRVPTPPATPIKSRPSSLLTPA
ncbi:hypothetical protein O3P69_015174 [Scylla paramamosain]|uniref:Uncharacterized protein n=1 Tax=Scylla paramamosain TaxID=85552 RepID=A0AAW0T4V5_SCYPA